VTAGALGRIRVLTGPTTAILIVAGLAWLGTVIWAQDMDVVPGTMGMSLLAFVVMWTLMMTAVMLPSALPMITIYSKTIRTSRGPRIASFASGYLLAWSLTGVPAFLLAWTAGEIATEYSGWTTAASVVIFASAGIYQLTSLKYRCLQHCRSPIANLLHYGNYRGRLRDLRAGAHHGFFCLGCCWGLMLLMIAFGVMNLFAMAALAGVIAIEKQWKHGERFAQAAGVACLVLAVAVIFFPDLAPGLNGDVMTSMGDMGM
jgi:predicted metal-binding membrane protein